MEVESSNHYLLKRLGAARSLSLVVIASLLLGMAVDGLKGNARAQGVLSDLVDHSAYDRLLKTYVNNDGLVNYKAWKARDEDTLRNYVTSLGKVDPDRLSRNEKLAFWINAYNALTIQGILEFYPVKSIKDKVSRVLGFNIWDDYPMTVDGKRYSLNYIEHKILRKMGEPRIHFTIVCASIGCPKLRNEGYTGKHLDSQLDDQARWFFSQPLNLRIDRDAHTVYLSSILKWFGEDFGGSDHARLEFVSKYLNDKDKGFLQSQGLDVKYLDYDWSLNEQKSQ